MSKQVLIYNPKTNEFKDVTKEQKTESIHHVKTLKDYIKSNGLDPEEVDILCS